MQRLPRCLSRHPPPAAAAATRATPGADALQRCRQVPPAEVSSAGAARAPPAPRPRHRRTPPRRLSHLAPSLRLFPGAPACSLASPPSPPPLTSSLPTSPLLGFLPHPLDSPLPALALLLALSAAPAMTEAGAGAVAAAAVAGGELGSQKVA